MKEKQNSTKSLIKLVAISMCISAILLISTFSWFTSNRETAANGMQLMVTTMPFDIATKGTSVRHESVLNEVRNIGGAENPIYVSGTTRTLTNHPGNEEASYQVASSLKLRFTPAEDNPNTPVNESLPQDIGPGSSGELSLYVVPKSNEAMNVKITLDVSSFASVIKLDAQGQPIVDENDVPQTELIEIKDAQDFAAKASASGVYNQEAANDAAAYVQAAQYLRGHILFFSGLGDTANATESSRYYFTDPYTTQTNDGKITFTFSVPANCAGKAVQVPIYWMWTNTLGQIILPDNVSEQRYGYPILADTNTTDKASVITYLTNNMMNMFMLDNYASTADDITAVATHKDTKTDFDRDNLAAFNALSKGYNKADYAIGTRIAYFLIEVTVEMA